MRISRKEKPWSIDRTKKGPRPGQKGICRCPIDSRTPFLDSGEHANTQGVKTRQHEPQGAVLTDAACFFEERDQGNAQKPATVAPARMAHESFDWLHRKPIATPGSTAWESVSPKRESLRVTIRLPIVPQFKPMRIAPKEPSSRICPTRKESDGFFQGGCPPENRFVLLARGGQRERAMRNKSQPCRQSGTLAVVFRVCLRLSLAFWIRRDRLPAHIPSLPPIGPPLP